MSDSISLSTLGHKTHKKQSLSVMIFILNTYLLIYLRPSWFHKESDLLLTKLFPIHDFAHNFLLLAFMFLFFNSLLYVQE